MKLKQSDKKILLIAAGVIILIGTYFFIFSGLNTKRAEITRLDEFDELELEEELELFPDFNSFFDLSIF